MNVTLFSVSCMISHLSKHYGSPAIMHGDHDEVVSTSPFVLNSMIPALECINDVIYDVLKRSRCGSVITASAPNPTS